MIKSIIETIWFDIKLMSLEYLEYIQIYINKKCNYY